MANRDPLSRGETHGKRVDQSGTQIDPLPTERCGQCGLGRREVTS